MTSAAKDTPPQGVVMQMVMGAWLSRTISAVTRLDVPDILQKHGPLTAQQLTDQHGVRASVGFLHRALRACASAGLFTEDAAGRFGPTKFSETLTTDSPVSVKKMTELFGGSMWTIWGGLTDALRAGSSQTKARLGMEFWEYLEHNPQEMDDFAAAMKSNSLSSMKGVLDHCDFSPFATVVDVAGGLGHLAIALLKRYPKLRATVLDLSELVPKAKSIAAKESPELLPRLTFLGGDMFEDVPPAETYVMKHIIHDWDDARCVRLLSHCRKRMQGDGRVFCIDAVLPSMGDTSCVPAKLLDMNMLVCLPGKERTLDEWTALYEQAGLRIASTKRLNDNFGTSIVEGRRT